MIISAWFSRFFGGVDISSLLLVICEDGLNPNLDLLAGSDFEFGFSRGPSFREEMPFLYNPEQKWHREVQQDVNQQRKARAIRHRND